MLASARPRSGGRPPSARPRGDQQRADGHREHAEAGGPHRRGPAAPAGAERSARRRAAGGDRRPGAAARGLRQAPRRAHAENKDKDAAPAPETDAAAAELASEKQKHDALDANLRTARALLLKVDDNATRIGAKRRELFARETFARSSSRLQSAIVGERGRRDPPGRRRRWPRRSTTGSRDSAAA